jgi:cytidylate kinase
MIVTISREYGAGGSEVAQRVAAALGWRLVDNEVIDQVAKEAGLPPEEVAQKEERAPGFLERLTRALARAAPELFPRSPDRVPEPEEAALVRVTERVVEKLAAGDHVVVVGRAAPAFLSERDALHVKLVAPKPVRIRRAMARLHAGEAEAIRVLEETDAARARYHQQYYQRDWYDPTHYHMVLNTDALGIEGTAQLIVSRIRESQDR